MYNGTRSHRALPVHSDTATAGGRTLERRQRRIVMTRRGRPTVLADQRRVGTVLVPAGHVGGRRVHVAA